MSDDGFKTYLFSYHHQGAFWSVAIKATSPEDARERIRKMAYAVYDGELVAKIPTGLGLVTRVAVALRNLIAGRSS